MRCRTMMFAASLWLAASPLQATESAVVPAADNEMQLLLQQLDNLPESERQLMEQALRGDMQSPAQAQVSAPVAEQTAMQQLLQELDGQLPESERRLMEQALQQSADTPCKDATEEQGCKRA